MPEIQPNSKYTLFTVNGTVRCNTNKRITFEDRLDVIWTSKDGTRRYIYKLELQHLRNIVAMFRDGRLNAYVDIREFFELELAYRENNR